MILAFIVIVKSVLLVAPLTETNSAMAGRVLPPHSDDGVKSTAPALESFVWSLPCFVELLVFLTPKKASKRLAFT